MKVDWGAAREQYVVGDESFAELAKHLGVSTRAVEHHASDRKGSGSTWAESRAAFRANVDAHASEHTRHLAAEAALRVQLRHAETLEKLATVAEALMVEALKACEPRDIVKFGLAIIALERRVNGLDRTQVEVTGKDGGPIVHDVDLGIDDETRDLAARALDALFGDAASDERERQRRLRVA